MLLKRKRFIENDEAFVETVLDRLILFGDISALVNDYKKKRRRIEQSKRLAG